MYQPTAYLLRHAQRMPTEQYRQLEQILPENRRERMLRYRREEDRKNCVLAYCLLEYALKRQFGIRRMPEMRSADSGKPYFTDKAMPRFNWSHCHGGILCAVDMQEVGCDIQDDILDAQVLSENGEKARIRVAGEEIEVNNFAHARAGDKSELVIRPEAAKLSETGVLEGTVTLSTFMGSYQYYQMLVDGMEIQITDYNPVNRRIYEVGEKAFLEFDPRGVYIL